jgi:hypothetical protein
MEATEEKIVHFWTTGPDFTHTLRDLWDSNLVYSAITICLDGGMDVEAAVKVCTGKLKLEGDTRNGDHTLDVVEDNTPPLFDIEKQITHLEDNFVYNTDHVSFLRRNMELGKLPTAQAASYRKDGNGYSRYAHDEETLTKVTKKVKEIVAGLGFLYPLVGKSLLDVPYERLGQKLSDIEESECARAWGKVYEHVEQRKLSESYISDAEEKVDEILQTPKKVEPDTANITSYHNGWISPEGEFYGCSWQEHRWLAGKIVEQGIVAEMDGNDDYTLEVNNWMKLQNQEFVLITGYRFSDFKLPTQKQIDLIINFCNKVYDGKIHYNFSEYPSAAEFLEFLEQERGVM